MFVLACLLFACGMPAHAQTAPTVGYVFPAAAAPGTTVDVRLGGYDWTPDIQFFIHDQRIEMEILGPPGPIIVPEPPYWFGGRSFSAALPLPREVAAKITIPADMPSGPIHWQVANANGGSGVAKFFVAAQRVVVENSESDETQDLGELPVSVSGQLRHNEEVDQYQFVVPQGGPVTCYLETRVARPIDGSLIIVDAATQELVADVVGTDGRSPVLTFAATAGVTYIAKVHDVDYRGNRSYVYRLDVRRGPRVLGAKPAAGRRGETLSVEFVGIGVHSGQAKLESTRREVTFPDDSTVDRFDYRLETEFGESQPFALLMEEQSDEIVVADEDITMPRFMPPFSVTGVLLNAVKSAEFEFEATKDQAWQIAVSAKEIGSTLDPLLTVIGPDGKTIAENDDLPGTPDAGLVVTAPTDGIYRILVHDLSGNSSDQTGLFRLTVARPADELPDFALEALPNMNLVVGEKGELVVKVVRRSGLNTPIQCELAGLPPAVQASGDLLLAADQSELKIPLESAADGATLATMVTLTATADVEGKQIRHRAEPFMFCSTMKPRCTVTPVEKDGSRAVHAGTTFPAEVIIERLEEFTGEVHLEMASGQGRHRQGIRGPEMTVPPEVDRLFYPVFAPEWLETTRTSRLVCNAVAVVEDPQGNPRYLLNRMSGRITMSLEGALLKISQPQEMLYFHPGDTFTIPVSVVRSAKLPESVKVELIPPAALEGLVAADPQMLATVGDYVFPVRTTSDPKLYGEFSVIVRATALQDGKYPAISETTVHVIGR